MPITNWNEFLDGVKRGLPSAVELRREIHRDPRVSNDEADTRDLILSRLGNPPWEAVAETGGIVRIGRHGGPTIGIRAELDALPLEEATDAEIASQNGAMHACGHDVHIAAAYAVARAAQEVSLPMDLLLVMQPREEAYPSGARDICESGRLEANGLRKMLGGHVHPRVPKGGFAVGAGAVNAAADEFKITVKGDGGHAAYPHHSNDPVVAISTIIVALQTIVSRNVDPMRPAVVTVGYVSSGTAQNVIPNYAEAVGTIRTMNRGDRSLVAEELKKKARLIAESFGCTASIELIAGEPVLFNDEELTTAVSAALSSEGIQIVEPMRSCGSDDFSYYSDVAPSLMMFVGVGDGESTPALHSPYFMPDDSVVEIMAMGYAHAVIASMERSLGI